MDGGCAAPGPNEGMLEVAQQKFADESEVRVSELMLPSHSNFFGTVHGGHVLAVVDNIAYVCAARFAGATCVTAAVDRVDFHHPVRVGELLNLVARVVYAGRTSIEVEISVFAEDIQSGNVRHTNSCHLTMVAVHEGKPVPVPTLVCRTREDKARYIQAKMRREMGIKYREERDAFLSGISAMDDAALDAVINGEKSLPAS